MRNKHSSHGHHHEEMESAETNEMIINILLSYLAQVNYAGTWMITLQIVFMMKEL